MRVADPGSSPSFFRAFPRRKQNRSGRAFVVGAGLAGLSAALALIDRGRAVTVFEASPHLGGRCRSYPDPELGLLDNGTHALTAANPVALGLLARLGLRGRWRRSGGGPLPLVDIERGQAFTLSGRLSDFVALGLRPRHLAALLGSDRPVASLFEAGSPAYRRLLEPLTVAALNTAGDEASSRLLRRIFLEAWRGPGALIPLVAERGLGPDLVEPLGQEIRARGGAIETGTRVRAMERQHGSVSALDLGQRTIALDPEDVVVLATPPMDAERLTELSFGFAYSPIVNAHFALPGEPLPVPRFIGVIGGTAQWILLRSRVASVTVSAADALAEEPSTQVADRLWHDVRAALRLAGIDAPETPLAHRIVKERRATIRQTPRLARPGAVTPWSNLFLAGDWTNTGLPATIEGALRSGLTAAGAASRPLRRLGRA